MQRKRVRNIQELQNLLVKESKRLNEMIRKGIVKQKEIRRFNVASNMFVNLVKRAEEHGKV